MARLILISACFGDSYFSGGMSKPVKPGEPFEIDDERAARMLRDHPDAFEFVGAESGVGRLPLASGDASAGSFLTPEERAEHKAFVLGHMTVILDLMPDSHLVTMAREMAEQKEDLDAMLAEMKDATPEEREEALRRGLRLPPLDEVEDDNDEPSEPPVNDENKGEVKNHEPENRPEIGSLDKLQLSKAIMKALGEAGVDDLVKLRAHDRDSLIGIGLGPRQAGTVLEALAKLDGTG